MTFVGRYVCMYICIYLDIQKHPEVSRQYLDMYWQCLDVSRQANMCIDKA